MNNKSYVENVCYNISMINLIANQKIEEFKTEITKIIINLIENHIQYHMEELCDCCILINFLSHWIRESRE